MSKKTSIIVAVLIISVFVMSACANESDQNTQTQPTAETASPTASPSPIESSNGYLNSIYMFKTIPSRAYEQLLSGSINLFASGLSTGQITEEQESGLLYETSVKRQYELLLNPADTLEATGSKNPLSFPEVRESLNLLIDREYIVNDIFSGSAIAKYQPLVYGSNDYNNNLSQISELAIKYQYDFESANQNITEILTQNGFELNEDGNWIYKDNVVELIVLIRNDDSVRIKIGEYAASQLELLGFVVTKNYVSLSESTSLWAAGDPAEGQWHVYTGRRTLDSSIADQDSVFADYYTDMGENGELQLYKLFVPDEDFYQAASDLSNQNFVIFEQREQIISKMIDECNDYSYRIWLVDELFIYPYNDSIQFESNKTTGMDTDLLTVFSLQSADIPSAEVSWGSESLLSSEVNPVNGSTSSSEAQILNFVELPLIYENSDTGQKKPLFIKSVQITYQKNILFLNDQSWIEVDTAEEIAVPNDAILTWDSESNSAVYADIDYMHSEVGTATAWLATYEREKPRDREKIQNQQAVIKSLQAIENRGYLTSNVKYTVEYDESIYDLKWHDDSSFSVADIIMAFITKTQLMDEKSPMYDEYYAQQHAGELDGFKGFKIISQYPLKIEYYSDSHNLYTSETIDPFWLDYGTGQQNWALAAAANASVIDKTSTYSKGISNFTGYSLLDFASGKDSMDIIKQQLESLIEIGFIPFEELIGVYITKEMAAEQYQRILDFYSEYEHLIIGVGPYMVTSVDALTPSVALTSYPDFPFAREDLLEKLS